MNGNHIHCADNNLFLGIVFYSKLTFVNHILNLKKNYVSSKFIVGVHPLTSWQIFRSKIASLQSYNNKNPLVISILFKPNNLTCWYLCCGNDHAVDDANKASTHTVSNLIKYFY